TDSDAAAVAGAAAAGIALPSAAAAAGTATQLALGGSQLLSVVGADFISAMLARCYSLVAQIYVSTHRHREALETIERLHLHGWRDRLSEKLLHNFTPRPSLDHISAVVRALDSPMVYFLLSYRFEWDPDTHAYDVGEHLHTWVVPKGATEMKFVTVDV